ncbi:CPBP family intramembrane glutamic endopeptidase [Lentzea nigeriaca]|uniref:CPBP family intramembrane glutamic endopeptidase n=1 Tax=Lentzea nigeriaca TaxID=1128665 RepID=UPI00195AE52F|nr:CPBP family intramembrane glutamic endopeptidase [Lentzea nigeriaca]MBM7857208.1 membrane protease YdiL (CAAX protease family) [Lentzea nigeriaca]
MSQPGARVTWPGAVGRAVAGTCVMAVALGIAGAVGQAVRGGTAPSYLPRALTAVLCFALAVSLILWLRLRVDRLPLSGLGLARGVTALRTFTLGVVITGGSAAAVLGACTWAGWLTWGQLDLPRLLEFLVVNALIAVTLEAFPEELVFRGYVYDALSRGCRRWVAVVVTVLLFTFAGAGSSVVHWGVGTLLGEAVPLPGFAPAGEDPVAYAILYPIFGVALLAARITTGSLWTSVGLHLTYLTVVRATIDGASRNAGWSATPVVPEALLLVPSFLVLATAVFALISRLRGRRT